MGGSMGYRILIDSCGDLSEQMKKDERLISIPLQIQMDDEIIVDDRSFQQSSFLVRMKEAKEVPKSACPSPELYFEKMKEYHDERIYVITLSSQLSGSHNAARLGRELLWEMYPDAQVEIFDSKSASIGETLIAIKIQELEEQGLSYEEVIEKTQTYINNLNIYFVLNSLENLRKNGRLTGIKAFLATKLNIKPICSATREGTITQLEQARGMNKALVKMLDIIEKSVDQATSKIIGIAHCNNLEKALMIKDEIIKRLGCKECIIVDTGGISSLYADDGGIIVAI